MIQPLLPVQGPLQKAPLSHGFRGCLMWDDEEDKVQCHVDGRWFKNLGAHIRVHGMRDDEYRMEYGMTFNYPLCSKGMSEMRREDITPQFISEGLAMRRRRCRDRGRRPNRPPRQIGTATQSEYNRHGLCELQIRARYNLVKRGVGHSPSSPELRALDRPLLEAITRRYGTLNNYRELIGEPRVTLAEQNRRRAARRNA